MSLTDDLQHVINCNSAENGSNTPDFMLAEFLTGCLAAFNKTVAARETWYGRDPGMGPAGIPTNGRPVIVADDDPITALTVPALPETPLTVGAVIALLQGCDPDAYLCLDDCGLPLEVVAIHSQTEDGHRYSGRLHEDGRDVAVVYLGFLGDTATSQRLLDGMQAVIDARTASERGAVGGVGFGDDCVGRGAGWGRRAGGS
jgi:hypothetical protein